VTVLAILATLAAAIALWVGAGRHGAAVARGYRWLAGAALFWGLGLTMQLVLARSLGSSGALSLADVAPLLALGATAVGIMILTAPRLMAVDDDASRAHSPVSSGSVLAGLADGYVTAVSLLVIGWVVAFGTEYHNSTGGPGSFLLDLLHPLADLAVLGALLPVLTVAWRRTLLPYLSLLAATGADSLGVGARISGGHQGVLQQLAMIAAAILLGSAPWVKTLAARVLPSAFREGAARDREGVRRPGSADVPVPLPSAGAATIIAAIATGIAAFVVIVNGLASAPASGLALVIAGGAAVLVVTVRILMLVRENGVAVRMWRHSGAALRDLATRTSDMVIICDLDGTITYASPGREAGPAKGDDVPAPRKAGLSYAPEELTGRRLTEFVHPEDLPVARAAMRQALALPDDGDPVLVAADPVPGASAAGDAARSTAPMPALLLSPGGAPARTPKVVSDALPSGGRSPGGTSESDMPPNVAPAAEDYTPSGRFYCRVRAVDGTWRHVECAVLPYGVPGEQLRMLVAARDISDEVALRQQVAHLTFHDGLTGLPNRAYFEDRARAALGEAAQASGGAGGTRTGVIFLDLDGFTGINDSVGHGAGDLVLAQAARRLRGVVPARDTVARWGGDEFAVLVENAAGENEAADLAERLAQVIAGAPFKVAEREVSLTASVGVVVAGPGEETDLLLRNADVAMSQAKGGGRGRVEVYAEPMHAAVARRVELASDLKRAIDRDELRLLYQPVVELATSRMVGAEALVRWQRGDEEVQPREFLAVAEDSGLSGPLGEWVLREACEQGARWRAAGLDVTVAVNVSLRQLTAPRFPAELAAALDDSGLPPSALAIEVNERVLVKGAGQVTTRLAELREIGVRLAIDDFGTSYASLAYLRELPVDIIKIDPSFVAGLGNDPTLTLLTRTITSVGHDLGIQVVAEGIEHPRQLAELTDMGCAYGQGFLLARPMPAPGVEALIHASGTVSSGAGAAAITPGGARVSKAGAALPSGGYTSTPQAPH
jgi:diguanylate cyclase (GGDEF)-like protein